MPLRSAVRIVPGLFKYYGNPRAHEMIDMYGLSL